MVWSSPATWAAAYSPPCTAWRGSSPTCPCARGSGGRWPSRVVAHAPSRRPVRLAWEQAGLPALLRRLDVDIHHSPHYTMPLVAPCPVVVTVHDLSFFTHPEWHERTKVAFFTAAI